MSTDDRYFVRCRGCEWTGDLDDADGYDDGDGRFDFCCPACGDWLSDLSDARDAYNEWRASEVDGTTKDE